MDDRSLYSRHFIVTGGATIGPSVMCSILIAEDNPDTCEAIAHYVAELGHDAHQAGDGVEALERLRTLRPCILLLDLRMPRMDGWELLSVLRKEPDLGGIPVIVLSAHVLDGRPPPVLPAAAFWPK